MRNIAIRNDEYYYWDIEEIITQLDIVADLNAKYQVCILSKHSELENDFSAYKELMLGLIAEGNVVILHIMPKGIDKINLKKLKELGASFINDPNTESTYYVSDELDYALKKLRTNVNYQ